MLLALHAWLDGDEDERNGQRLAAFVIEKAISGHFGFFKVLLDLVDGKLRRTAEEETSFEPDCVLVLADDGRESQFVNAA
jgi:hypothetical protein